VGVELQPSRSLVTVSSVIVGTVALAVGATQITVINFPVAGTYLVHGQATIAGGVATTGIEVYLQDQNGPVQFAASQFKGAFLTSDVVTFSVMGIVVVGPGDNMIMAANVQGGAATALNNTNTNNLVGATGIWAIKLS
jgi:hypothetical protein